MAFHESIPTAPHRRYNPLTGQWVLVSAQRNDRPWGGSHEKPSVENLPGFDPGCYLCPGNDRANGEVNPTYKETFSFTNDFPALVPDVAPDAMRDRLLVAETEPGTSRVLVFSPEHNLTLANMELDAVSRVVDMWADETEKLGQDHKWVQIFENRGAAMGASNPHPHGQIWAGHSIPDIPAAEDHHLQTYFAEHKRALLVDYLDQERNDGSRIITENDGWVALVPFWAVWPFESLILPKRPVARLPDVSTDDRLGLASMLRTLLQTYDKVFDHPFPYSMGWHGAPFNDQPNDHWLFHGHVFPPLLRSATVRKFMVGYELLAGVQRDITAESAAERLRGLALQVTG